MTKEDNRAKLIEAIAASWASIDGKGERYEADKRGELPPVAGWYQGYLCEAEELLERAEKRLGRRVVLP